MRNLIRREICGIYETNDLTKEQKKKYMRSEFDIIKGFGDKKVNMQEVILSEKQLKIVEVLKKVMML